MSADGTGDAPEMIDVDGHTDPAVAVTDVFVMESTALGYRLWPEEGKLTFSIGRMPGSEVALFVYGEALDRLILGLVEARNALQQAHYAHHAGDLAYAPMETALIDLTNN